jgi:hypothetical protein
MTLIPGQRLGPYEIGPRLGVGGMGEVYRARDTRLDRSVAIKLLSDDLRGDADGRRRLEIEARAISSLSHPNICALHDVGGEDGVEYLVMELLEGETLAQRLERGALPPAEALTIADQIAAGLDRAHRDGIVHRDLKPANVMLTRHGVKLLDFGLARFDPGYRAFEPADREAPGSQAATRAAHTAEGTILGTLHYMAPEQLEGQPVDARADVFAFGAVVYEMLTGRRAFDGSSAAAVWSAILRDEPAPVRASIANAPPGLDPILSGCLAKDPELRWRSLHDVRLLLRGLAAEVPAVSGQSPRSRSLAVLATGLALGAAAWWLVSLGSARTTAPRAVAFELSAPPGVSYAESIEDTTFALSPDGATLAFVGSISSTSKRAVFVRPLSELVARQLTGTEGAHSIFWSPDGQSLGLFADGKLKVASVTDNEAVMTICEVGRGIGINGSWGHDRILFATVQGREIHAVRPVPGSTPEVVVEGEAGPAGRVTRPQFLADGRRFLYSAARDNTSWTLRLADENGLSVDVAGGILRAVPSGPNQLVYAEPNHLVSRAFDANRGVLEGTPRVLAPRVRAFASTAHASFSAALDGTVAFADQSPALQLVRYDRTGLELARLGEVGDSTSLALDLEGHRAVIDRMDPERAAYDVWMVDLLRGAETRLTSDQGTETGGVWLRDGRLLYSSSTEVGGGTPQIVERDGTGRVRPLLAPGGFQLAIDIDPSTGGLFYIERSGSAGFSLKRQGVGTDGGTVTLLEGVTGVSMSPDGLWLTFVRRETTRPEVYLIPTQGGDITRVSLDGAALARFEPDGSALLFIDLSGKLWRAALRLAHPPVIEAQKLLFELPPLGWRAFRVAPDGTIYALAHTVDTTAAPLKILVGGAG